MSSSGDRLVPLPRRAPDGAEVRDAVAASPVDTVSALLERTDHLLTQLQQDIAKLQAGQAVERQRIDEEAAAHQQAADDAIGDLEALVARAREVAERKAQSGVLERALAQPATFDPTLDLTELMRRCDAEIHRARGFTGSMRLTAIGQLLTQASSHVAHMAEQAEAARQHWLRQTDRDLAAEGKEARASYEIGMSLVRRDLKGLAMALPPAASAWDDEGWSRWQGWGPRAGASPWVRLGDYFRPELSRFRFPALVQLPGPRGLAIDVAHGDRILAVDAVRSLLVRLLASIPGGDAELRFIDPLGLGESVAPLLPLGGYRAELVGEVATTEEHIEATLNELTRHVERIIQEHLRGAHESLEAHQLALGETVEPYRFLVVFDFPDRFSDRARQLLRNLIDNGARGGVGVIVVTAPGPARGSSAKWRSVLAGMTVITGDADGFAVDDPVSGTWRVDLDGPPALAPVDEAGERTLFGRILARTGERARESVRDEVTPERLFDALREACREGMQDDLPVLVGAMPSLAAAESWWTGDARPGLAVPVGRAGARRLAVLGLDSAASGGAVVYGGQNPSGASPLLASIVAGWFVLYGPNELGLYLCDLTPDAESGSAPSALSTPSAFAAFARDGLPQARVVATAAGREFAVSMLDALHREMGERSVRFVAGGGPVEYGAYRAITGAVAPRLVAVLNGIEHLVADDDRLGDRALELLEALAVEGPAHGIHVVAGVGDLTALSRLGATTLGHWPVRVAMACPDDESRLLLGPANAAAAACAHDADAVLGCYGGDAAASPVVRTATFAPLALSALVRAARQRADLAGASDRPYVHDRNQPARLDVTALAEHAGAHGEGSHRRRHPRLWLGEPQSLGPPVEVALRRRPGGNLLVVGSDDRSGDGIVLAAIASAALVLSGDLDVRVLDLMPLESGFSERVTEIGCSMPVTVTRRRNRDEVLAGVLAEVGRRHEVGDAGGSPVLFVVNGLGTGPVAALEIGQVLGGATVTTPDDVAHPGLDLVAVLERIARDGPEVGVHLVVRTDRLASLAPHLSCAALRELAVRVVMRMPAEDSALLVDSTRAQDIGDHEALLYDEDRGRLVTFRPFRPMTRKQVAELATHVSAAGDASAPRPETATPAGVA